MLMASSSLAVTVPNGSFEDGADDKWVTTISDWTLIPPVTVPPSNYRSGLFFDFDGYTAPHQDAFAILTHHRGGGQSIFSDVVLLGHLDLVLDFEYLYATQNAPGDTTHIDPFTVTVWSGTTALDTVTVSDVDDSNLAEGTLSSTPFQPNGTLLKTYDTGWQTFSVDLSDYIGQSVFFEFRINDSAVRGGNAGFFLDNVTVTPEPGTFLLFGIGALGLTLYSRRKLRRKK